MQRHGEFVWRFRVRNSRVWYGSSSVPWVETEAGFFVSFSIWRFMTPRKLLLASCFWMLVVGLPVGDSIMAIVTALFLGVIGFEVLCLLIPHLRTSNQRFLWILGPALAIGLIVLFLIRAITSRTVFLIITLLVGAICVNVFMLGIKQRWSQLKEVKREFESGATSIALTISVVGLPLAKLYPWVWPVIVVGLALSTIPNIYSLKSLWATHRIGFDVVALSLTALLSHGLRSNLWWMNADDNQLFEAMSHGQFEWGPRVNVIQASGSGLQALAYHHLAYFLTGLFDFVAVSDPYLALTRVAPIVISISLTASIQLLISLVSHVTRMQDTLIFLLAGLFQLLNPVVTPLSNFLGCVALVSAICIFLQTRSEPSTPRMYLAMALSFAAVAFSKVTYLYAAFVVCLCLILIERTACLRRALAVIVPTVALVTFFSAFSAASSDFHIDWFSENSLSEHSYGGLAAKVLAIVVVIAPACVGVYAAVRLLSAQYRIEVRSVALGSLCVVMLGVIARVLVGGRIETIRYLWEPALIMANLSFVLWLLCEFDLVRQRVVFKSWMYSVSVAACVAVSLLQGYLFPFLFPDIASGSLAAKTLRFLRSSDLPIFLLSIGLFISWRISKRRNISSKHPAVSAWNRLAAMVPLLVTSVVIGSFVASIAPSINESFSEARSGQEIVERLGWLGDQPTIQLAQYLAKNNKPDDLTAVSLCDADLPSCSHDYVLAGLSRNRFFSLGGSAVLVWQKKSGDQYRDYRYSVQIGEDFSVELLDMLKRDGVTRIVFDKRYLDPQASRIFKEVFADNLFENSRYVLVTTSQQYRG